jgi:hypothetical protein
VGLASGGSGEKDISLEPAPDADYGIFGVRAKRDDQPVRPAMLDRQRIYTGPGTAGMGTTPRFKNSGGASLNKTGAGSFKVRKRTLKG